MSKRPDRPPSSPTPEADDGAEQAVLEAVRKRFVDPARVLECIYYAAEDDLLLLMRSFVGLDDAARAQILSYTLAFEAVDGGRRRGN